MARWLDPSQPLGALVAAGILIVIGLVLSWAARRVLIAVLALDRRDQLDKITLSFLSHLSILMIWLILLTIYVHLVPALNRLETAMLAGVSLISIVVGFAAQTTLGNLIAGVSLVLYKPFRRGDRLQIAAPTDGGFLVAAVDDISLGFTLLITDDGRRVIVANGTMMQQTVVKLPPKAAPPPG